MATRLSKLRIAGFKSFAEPVNIDILPGLTGIVGPNGCGKSNVVEALRWAMGETSARSLRGGEMDDVIFAGTTARASRNLAEVTVTLDGDLPAPFEAEADLQVTRRIERGSGSSFRVNGREQRARDVQTLYADLASGARSSGMVSQGRVSQLVNAKPEERRQVLEEAAGITGLHARRHEAELKLRATEQNLARAEDVRTQLDTSRESMRKQARGAARYRNISGLIRTAQIEHLAILMACAQAALGAAADAHALATARVHAKTADAEACADALDQAEQRLPALREALSQSERSLERRRIAAEGLSEEADRVNQAAAQAEQRVIELQADLDAAEHARADAAASVARLEQSRTILEQAAARLPGDLEVACAERDRLQAALHDALAHFEWADSASRAANLNQAAARDSEQAARARADSARARQASAAAELAEAARALVPEAALADAEDAAARAEADLSAHRGTAEAAEAASDQKARNLAGARAHHEHVCQSRRLAEQSLHEAEARLGRLGRSQGEARAALDALHADIIPSAYLNDAEQAARNAAERAHTAEARVEECERQADEMRQARESASRSAADAATQFRQAAEAGTGARARAEKLRVELAAAEQALSEAMCAAPDPNYLAESEVAHDAATLWLAGIRRELETYQKHHDSALATREAARACLHTTRADAARLAGEAEGLQDQTPDQASAGLTGSAFTLPEGLEAAIGAALNDGAEASLESADARFWRELPKVLAPSAPPGTTPLSSLVQAPAALVRLLDACFLIPQEMDGDALQAVLPPGAAAVRRDGACWHWDGRVTRPGAPNPAAMRLLRARRLAAARLAQSAAEQASACAEAEAERAQLAEAEANAAVQALRSRLTGAEAAAHAARERRDDLRRGQAEADVVLSALQPSLLRLRSELRQADALVAEAETALTDLADPCHAIARARDADTKAGEAANALHAARAERQQARAAMTLNQDALGRSRQRQAETETRIAASTPALQDLEAQHLVASSHADAARETLFAIPDPALSEAALRTAAWAEQESRQACHEIRDVCAAAAQARDESLAALNRLRAMATTSETRHAALREICQGADEAASQAQLEAQRAIQRAESLPDLSALEAADTLARCDAEQARTTLQQARGQLHALEAERAQLVTRIEAATADLSAWQARLEAAADRAAALCARTQAARRARHELGAAPDALAARVSEALSGLAGAQSDHAATRDLLVSSEQHARTCGAALRDTEQRLATLREESVRAEAAAGAAFGVLHSVHARVAERLGDDAVLPETAETSDLAEERARRRFERLTHEREEMGPVNLRADLELTELETRLTQLDRERNDLATAIAKLRGAIGHLNREGRERLAAVFTQVDQHFRTLFTRMMGGGRAHLALTGSDDPLTAGLEIYAEPPGKKLASLALLSGGEQALTALSLIFAVFRCSPAPISVLDEVDAPLDDANVDRFCTLLDDVVRETGTRFLVVTHHQLTMSRMDRLYGVTMQERGVSRLLSVDLRQAEAYAASEHVPVLAAAE